MGRAPSSPRRHKLGRLRDHCHRSIRPYRVLVDPNDWTSGFISRADVADFLVKQVD